MPFVVQRPGYIISPYFDYLSFRFNKRWRRPADRILALMIKLADSEHGSVPVREIAGQDAEHGGPRPGPWRRRKRSAGRCSEFGVDPKSVFLGTLNAGHPGGMLPLTAADAETLHPERLPANLYVADATLFPRSLGNPPILTILALARRVARVAMAAQGARDGSAQQRKSA